MCADRVRSHRLRWAELLQRVFEVEALRCAECGGRMRLVAAIEDPEVARKILECVGLPARAPPLGPARGASAGAQTDSWDEEPAWAFDETPPEDGMA